MVRLITDTPQYANDIAEEIRMFLGLVPVTPDETPETELTIRTALDRETKAAAAQTEPAGLTVDRPFVFLLLDNESNLPVLAGTVVNS